MSAALVRNLLSRRPEVREEALLVARSLPPEEKAQLILLALKTHRRQQKTQRWKQTLLPIITMLAVLGTLWSNQESLALIFSVLIVGLCLVWVPSACIYLFYSLTGQRFRPRQGYEIPRRAAERGLATLLQEAKDPRLLVPIGKILLRADVRQRDDAMSALVQALRQMVLHLRPETTTPAQREMLLALLRSPFADEDLLKKILKVLEQVGDASAIPEVEHLAQVSIASIRRAANECLPYLRLHAEQSAQAQTLLRASQAEASQQPETLLRPVTYANETPVEDLLRSSHVER